MDQNQAAEVQKNITAAMKKVPAGLITVPSKDNISAVIWNRTGIGQKDLYEMFIGGLALDAIKNGHTTKEDILIYLAKSLR